MEGIRTGRDTERRRERELTEPKYYAMRKRKGKSSNYDFEL